MRKSILRLLTLLILCMLSFFCNSYIMAQTKNNIGLSPNYTINQISLTKWDSPDGIKYTQVTGANLGATSFEIMDDHRFAFLCNSTSEIVIIDKISGNAIKRFNVRLAPRDFTYSNGYFYVLTEFQVIQYDDNGKEINSFSFSDSYRGVERITRVNNSTYLLLPSGNCVRIEANGMSVVENEKIGWITGSGNFIETNLTGLNSYKIKLSGNDKISEKIFAVKNKVAGVYVVGATSNRLVIDLQTFISEDPISVERNIIMIELNNDQLGAVIGNIKVPDCYYVLSNKDLSLLGNGTILNMITAPQGVYIFGLNETYSGSTQGYPSSLLQTKYHFNDHIIQNENY